MTKGISFENGLKYPWNNAKRLWNILWILIPIFGFFAIFGYIQKIVQSIVKGHEKGLPEFGKFWENCGKGFMYFIRFLPTIIVVQLISIIPIIGWLAQLLISFLLMPYLVINLFVKDKFSALWEIEHATKIIIGNFKEYIIAIVKNLFYGAIYILASFVLVGIPCLTFGNNIYVADFYKNHHK